LCKLDGGVGGRVGDVRKGGEKRMGEREWLVETTLLWFLKVSCHFQAVSELCLSIARVANIPMFD
jgi:hypothetical protein